jgi:hypothetical protein
LPVTLKWPRPNAAGHQQLYTHCSNSGLFFGWPLSCGAPSHSSPLCISIHGCSTMLLLLLACRPRAPGAARSCRHPLTAPTPLATSAGASRSSHCVSCRHIAATMGCWLVPHQAFPSSPGRPILQPTRHQHSASTTPTCECEPPHNSPCTAHKQQPWTGLR